MHRHPPTAFALALILAGHLAAAPAAAQGGPPKIQVAVAHPLAKRITTWDEYSGRFTAIENVEVRPRVSGFIDKVHFKDGAIVKAGEPLFTIDKRPFELALESANAEIARTQAQVLLAENEVLRAQPLVKTQVITERDFEQRQANLSVARAQLQAAQANAKNADLNLEWTDVTAPISGRISDRKVDPGNLVFGSNQGTATLLATIVSIDPIHFEFDVSEADYLRYSRLFLSGQRPSSRDVANPVRVKLADESEWAHTGRMDFVDNIMNERSGTMRARAILDNKNQLFAPGVFARIALFGGESDGLLIPDAAVVSDQARKIVFTLGDNDVVAATPVTLGPIVDGLRVVTSGLTKDSRIVIDGLANPMVRPGVKVVPEAAEVTATAN